MLRALLLLAVLFGVAGGAVWLADDPGTITYTWRGNEGALSTTRAAALALAAAVLLCLFALVLGAAWRLPRTLRARRQKAAERKAETALTNAVVAVGSGDGAAATREAAQALAAHPNSAVATFIAAQAAQLAGDSVEAERHFAALASDPATRALGLSGLALEAERAGDLEAARAHALATLALTPSTPWAADLALRAAAAAGDFTAALDQLSANMRARLIDKADAQRLRAVLLTARALSVPGGIKHDALEAHSLAKDFVPAALAAAAALAHSNRRQAASVLAATYKRNPHPDLFRADLDLAGQSASDRLARAKPFAAHRPEHVESAIGLARAALSAREVDLARDTLTPHLAANPSQRVYLLMAEIEALSPGGEGKVRHCLAKAISAPRDPQWIADGVVAAAWAPISPVTGALDAFQWRVPETLGAPPTLTLSPLLEALPSPQEITQTAAEPGDPALAADAGGAGASIPVSVPPTAGASPANPSPTPRLAPGMGPFGPIPNPATRRT